MQPIITEPPSQSPPPVDTLYTPYSPLPGPREDAIDDACLSIKSNLPGDHPIAADDMLFNIYQDWVHQNPGTHLNGGIEEDGK